MTEFSGGSKSSAFTQRTSASGALVYAILHNSSGASIPSTRRKPNYHARIKARPFPLPMSLRLNLCGSMGSRRIASRNFAGRRLLHRMLSFRLHNPFGNNTVHFIEKKIAAALRSEVQPQVRGVDSPLHESNGPAILQNPA